MPMTHFSLHVPDAVRKRLRAASASGELGPAARTVLESCAGELADLALEFFPQTAPYKTEKWGRLAVRLPVDLYEEIKEASASTGIGRQRLPGVVLVGLQDRFVEILEGGDEKWGRLAVRLPVDLYEEIKEASASTGIGVVLVGLQDRFVEILEGGDDADH